MKKTSTLMTAVLCFLFFIDSIYSQNMNVTVDPDYEIAEASSIFEVKSLNKGLMIARMRHSRMLSIPSPATGLVVCNIVDNRFYYFDGDSWISSRISCDYLWSRNAKDIYHNNGMNVGIKSYAYSALLQTYSINTEVLFTGVFKAHGNHSASRVGAYSMWHPDKTAFSAGYVKGTHWNIENMGNFSTAMRFNTISSGSIPMQWDGRQWFEEEVPRYMDLIYLFLDIVSLLW